MKEATGEVSMTMVTIVAIAVIGGILVLVWPQITNWITGVFQGQQGCPEGTHLGTDGITCIPD